MLLGDIRCWRMTVIELVQLNHRCVSGQDKESVPHILLLCSRFVEARSELEDAVEDIYICKVKLFRFG